VKRIRNTPPQYGLDPAARRRNLKGAFTLTSDQNLSESRFVLIDDILTTGTTAGELSGLLKRAGCQWMGVLTVARVSVRRS
jgi:predicted amidophosphoribosyltransferase